ncbi:hypothetical protein [Pontibacter sp. G13]|uniref:hypothetical protein n=1 Tax=Pontibacter sp. G13 TaxID=3074898 RepID=UPI00288BC03E|nr:hypothetical protein [Pontibacter sp. G13]WNJ16683.1 hypothetical protein RJD25_17595 [Pontibacter sp. G13]
MKSIAYMLVIVAVGCTSCQEVKEPVEMRTVVVDSLYSVELPNNMKESYSMHAYANLQYFAADWNMYVIGLEDNKANLGEIKARRVQLVHYYDFVENTVTELVDTSMLIGVQSFILPNGLDAKIGDYYTYNSQKAYPPLFYRIAVYESDGYFFQLVLWTPYESSCDYIGWIDSITNSFDLIPTPEHLAKHR